jgi:hypothetical protein
LIAEEEEAKAKERKKVVADETEEIVPEEIVPEV